MLEQKQKFLHKPQEKIVGDCFRTCVACVLDLPRDSVPHVFQDVWWEDDATPLAHKALNEWLSTLNLRFVEVPIEAISLAVLRTYIRHYYRDMHVLIGCNSKNGGHSVVMRNEDYMWDPSLDNSGCVGPMGDGYFWLGTFVRPL